MVVVAFVVSGCDGAKVFELVEEPLDGVALSVDPRAERRVSDTVRHWPDISPSAACGKLVAQFIAVVGAVREQALSASRIVPASTVSNMSAAERPSWAWPSVSLRRIGRPMASTSAWILVVKPPRERPMQRDRVVFFGHWRRAGARGSKSCRSSARRLRKLLKQPQEASPRCPPSATC